jgi:hypothetical protein
VPVIIDRGAMEQERIARILVVANRTSATPWLLQEIERRVHERRCRFALLIPDGGDPRTADWTLAIALPMLEQAAAGRVEGLEAAGRDPFEAVQDALRQGHFDELIVSIAPRRPSLRPRRDLIRRLEALELPVTTVTPGERPTIDHTVLRVRVN